MRQFKDKTDLGDDRVARTKTASAGIEFVKVSFYRHHRMENGNGRRLYAEMIQKGLIRAWKRANSTIAMNFQRFQVEYLHI